MERSRLSSALIAILMLPAAGAAFAQDSNTEAAPQSSQETVDVADSTDHFDTVIVTGSRIKRAEIEGPAPITIISAADIEKQGYSNVYDALGSLTQFTGSVQNEFDQTGFTPNASFLNLRGLGPGYQLVLINGRRTADYPLPYNSSSNAVNLANIPTAAVERIEILSGGASAIYGSDAITGVVNIILKNNYEGDQFSLRAGTTSRGGGDSGRLQWFGGKGGDAFNVTYALEVSAREEILGSQRGFMDSALDGPANGPRTTGVGLFSGATGQNLWPAGLETTCARFEEFEVAGNSCLYNGHAATQSVRNSDRNLAGYVAGTWYLDDNTQAYGQINVSDSRATLVPRMEQWTKVFGDLSLNAYAFAVRSFAPSEIGGVDAYAQHYDETTFDATAGLRGSMLDGRFSWDATLSHSRYELDINRRMFLTQALDEYFLGQELGRDAQGRPIYAGINTDRLFNPLDADTYRSLSTAVHSEAESSVTQGTLVVSGDLFELPAGAVGMAALLEGARQSYELTPDSRTLPGNPGSGSFNLVSTGGEGKRNRYAFGLEFSVPLTSQLKASLAGRYDKYDDATAVDDAFTWSTGLEWRPFDSLLVRGSYATSFRAPDMHYMYASSSAFYIDIVDEFRCRANGVDPTSTTCNTLGVQPSVAGFRNGSTALEEEKGTSTTLGMVWDIIDDLSVSLDWYNIKLEGGVSDISVRTLMREEAACRLGTDRAGNAVATDSPYCVSVMSLVRRNGDGSIANYSSFPINQAMQETSGVDVNWRYKFETARLGDFNLGLGWSHVLDFERQEFADSAIEDTRDDRGFFNFRSRMNWSAAWSRGDWNANVHGYRWGSLPKADGSDRTAPYLVWNAGIGKKINERASLGLQVNNLFDKLAPRDDSYTQYPYFNPTYSPVGREVFVKFDYKFN
ncbi:TonB-dependent receptor plug domain-containing protein [Montanilutibacter psychrotolerans]|nr:TonB-dependent receptor [Lysobacter psychrotolerans]